MVNVCLIDFPHLMSFPDRFSVIVTQDTVGVSLPMDVQSVVQP